MNEAAKVRIANANEHDALIATLTAAFIADPLARFLYPEPRNYLRMMPIFSAGFSRKALDRGVLYTVAGYRGAALWQAPEDPGTADDDETVLQSAFGCVDPARLEVMGAIMEQVAPHHPTARHWYLPQIGIDPSAQGMGLGGALMQYALERVDQDGLPAFLESSNPRNVSFYQRFGFEPLVEIQIGDSPIVTPMLRAAR